jgi:hypothetical protein
MQPKYDAGTRVRVRVGKQAEVIGYADLRRFDNATGTVVDCRTVVAYPLYPAGLEDASVSPNIRLHVYTVEVEGGILLSGIVEESLEAHLTL